MMSSKERKVPWQSYRATAVGMGSSPINVALFYSQRQ